jgi:hypothetical protein
MMAMEIVSISLLLLIRRPPRASAIGLSALEPAH